MCIASRVRRVLRSPMDSQSSVSADCGSGAVGEAPAEQQPHRKSRLGMPGRRRRLLRPVARRGHWRMVENSGSRVVASQALVRGIFNHSGEACRLSRLNSLFEATCMHRRGGGVVAQVRRTCKPEPNDRLVRVTPGGALYFV